MSFKPLKDDAQLTGALDELSRVSERCVLTTEALNRWNRVQTAPPGSSIRGTGFDPSSSVKSKLMQNAEQANRDRRQAKQQILALINDRLSAAYAAGLQDGATQDERKGAV